MACQKGFHHHQRSVTGASHDAIRRKQFDTILLVNQQKFDNQTCNTNTTSIAININIKGSGGRGEENELSGTRPLATPVRERSSRSVGSRDGLSGSVELEAALRAVERNFLQPRLSNPACEDYCGPAARATIRTIIHLRKASAINVSDPALIAYGNFT